MSRIRIVSWNVNGIRAAYKKGLLDWFNEERPDILCIQETKARREQLPEELLEIDGYYNYFVSAEKKGYSGVALYTNKEPVDIKCGFGIEKFDSEGRIQIADFGDFVLYNIYFPNGKASAERLTYKMEFYDAFLEHANTLRSRGKRIIVCGDVNTAHKEIDLARPKENEKISGFLPQERAWIDKLLDNGYVDIFRIFNTEPENYTWWSMRTRARERNVGWRIDYFFASDDISANVKDAFILTDVMGSDHCPLGIDLEI